MHRQVDVAPCGERDNRQRTVQLPQRFDQVQALRLRRCCRGDSSCLPARGQETARSPRRALPAATHTAAPGSRCARSSIASASRTCSWSSAIRIVGCSLSGSHNWPAMEDADRLPLSGKRQVQWNQTRVSGSVCSVAQRRNRRVRNRTGPRMSATSVREDGHFALSSAVASCATADEPRSTSGSGRDKGRPREWCRRSASG